MFGVRRMQLVERHVINKNHIFYQEIEQLCFFSKNLYNAANYIVRQEYIQNRVYLNYKKIQKIFQSQIDYKALPAKVSQQVLMLLEKNWKSFFEASIAYEQEPSKFLGRPKLPKYKDKINGRNILVYTAQAISKRSLQKNNVIHLSQTNINIKTSVKYENLAQVRIVPKLNHYVVEIVYEAKGVNNILDKSRVAGIDLGITNLATIAVAYPGFQPLVINGNPLKAVNQYFNKKKADLQSRIKKCDALSRQLSGGSFPPKRAAPRNERNPVNPTINHGASESTEEGSAHFLRVRPRTSHKIQNLCTKRNFKVDDYLHKVSLFIITKLVENQIGTLVIGKNDGWKQESNIGKRNNQNFVFIPHERFIHQLKYKAELAGITVIVTEESYTSKASFLDLDIIPTYKKGIKHTFSGKRIQRGLYQSKSKRLINADVNGAYNIIRKAFPNAFSNGIEGFVVHPVRLNLQTRRQDICP
jgi:putative transposase